jgi:PilZ domain
MPDHDRRREDREPCPPEIGVFLTRCSNGAVASPVFQGVLTSISRHGAGIALAEIMVDRTHLAYGPMESDTLQLNIVFSSQDQDTPITLPVRPIWLNREQSEGLPPFRLGVEFLEPLTTAIFRRLNRPPR